MMLTLKTARGATAQGRIEADHLADHPAAVRELQEAMAVGARLVPLLVLERLEVLPLHLANLVLAILEQCRSAALCISSCGRILFKSQHFNVIVMK